MGRGKYRLVECTGLNMNVGRNGVGKTRLIKNMIHSIVEEDDIECYDKYGTFVFSYNRKSFANVVCVAYSAFDEFPIDFKKGRLPYTYIGLEQIKEDKQNNIIESRRDQLLNQFYNSIRVCSRSQSKSRRWRQAVSTLESDPMFEESNVISAIDTARKAETEKSDVGAKLDIYKTFNKLSSGHKIVILTITRLIETVEECTLVLLDEPEMHLHPPLLSAFIRALSELLIDRNGVAIITTHSPVILQEVPQSCVWKLRRNGYVAIAERLDIESFGENIGILTSEVFGLEVTNSGFHKMLYDSIIKYRGDYLSIVNRFNNELGSEARAILKVLINSSNMED